MSDDDIEELLAGDTGPALRLAVRVHCCGCHKTAYTLWCTPDFRLDKPDDPHTVRVRAGRCRCEPRPAPPAGPALAGVLARAERTGRVVTVRTK